MGFDSKVEVALKPPVPTRLSVYGADRFIYQSEKPEDKEYLLSMDFQIAETMRLEEPINLAAACRGLDQMTERCVKLVDHMRWTILTTGTLNIGVPGLDDTIVEFPHQEIEITSADEIDDITASLSQETEEKGHVHFVIANSTTAKQLNRRAFYKSGRPRIVWEVNDGGTYQGEGRHSYVPDGIVVVIPMQPPIVGQKVSPPKAKLMFARDNHWWIKYEQRVNFWMPDDAPVVTTYKLEEQS